MNDTKSKGGRPRRTDEKLQRITLNLKPSALFGLELVSRHRRTSLSQAAEYLLLRSLRAYEVENSLVFSPLEGTISNLASLGEWTQKNEDGEDVVMPIEDRELELQSRMMGSPIGRALLMPRSIQSPTELYFETTVQKILEADWNGHKAPAFVLLFLPDVLEQLFVQAKQFEERGISADEAGELLARMAMLAVDERAEQTPWTYIRAQIPKAPLAG